ncbi:Uncharacterised protein [Clostridioides difficile]|nr:Uncharacterised protein [Clostridioides difficile]
MTGSARSPAARTAAFAQSGTPVPVQLQRPSRSTSTPSVCPPTFGGSDASCGRTGNPRYPNQNRSGSSGGRQPGVSSIDGAMTASASYQSPISAAGGGRRRAAVSACSARSTSSAGATASGPSESDPTPSHATILDVRVQFSYRGNTGVGFGSAVPGSNRVAAAVNCRSSPTTRRSRILLDDSGMTGWLSSATMRTTSAQT